MKNKIHKITALFILMVLVFCCSSISIYAEETDEPETVTEETEQEEIPYVPIEHVEEITEEEYNEAIETEIEVIDLAGSENDTDTNIDGDTDAEIELMALDTGDTEKWKSLFADSFGENYYSGYAKYGDGARVSGNTNALVIENTDLQLEGKNGLDLVLRRRHNNHGEGTSYALIRTASHTSRQMRYFYTVTVSTDNSKIYVACCSEDDFYVYLKNGLYITSLPTTNRQMLTLSENGETRTI